MTETIRTRRGRTLTVLGDPALLTMDRLSEFTARADSDPRIASVSLVAGPPGTQRWLRAAAPAGPLVAVATDLGDLVGPIDAEDLAAVHEWLAKAAERGLWHDWWVTGSTDVVRATVLFDPARVDVIEADDPGSAHHAALRHYRPRTGRLTVTVDGTWLGPHETGAQVLTTAALAALVEQEAITEIRLVGVAELPSYAAHLSELSKLVLYPGDVEPPISDVVWYPNQIDGRSNIGAARRLGARVVTTYLDLIAYDIPRYHADEQAWLAYRALQRRIALSVDGITAISADVAHRLLEEVPRLEPDRVLALPLGLDHIAVDQATDAPGEDLADVVKALGGKRFVTVLGNDFQHKNRDFAIRVWQRALQEGHPCDLVLAGLHVKSSSSKKDEDDLIARHLDLRGRIHTVGHISSTSRAWLLSHADVVLYPTSAEGFGFIPYEAAALGTPTVFTSFGPLKEIAAPGRSTVELDRRPACERPGGPAGRPERARSEGRGAAGGHCAPHLGGLRCPADRVLRAHHPHAGGRDQCGRCRLRRGGRRCAVVDPVQSQLEGHGAAASAWPSSACLRPTQLRSAGPRHCRL
jgi:glycosyltransferase involved in cell wall biosynthesis